MEFNKVKLDRLDRLFLLSYHHKSDQKENFKNEDGFNPLTGKGNLAETAECNNNTITFETKNTVPKSQVTPMETLGNVTARRGSGTLTSYKSEKIASCTKGMIVKPIKMFIDLPTIDYYNDELAHNKIMKFNKKLKVHTLRDFILNEFQIPELSMPANNLEQENTTHDNLYGPAPVNGGASSDKKTFYDITIKSSGSLRYVGTIKYIIEECFTKLSSNRCRFQIQVTQTSLKWFNTYLNKDILALSSKFIDYKIINNNLTYSDGHSNVALTPFKEYYKELSRLFTSTAVPKTNTNDSWQAQSENDSWDECIIVVTNSTGIKALLTILSDRPLTNFLTQDSLNALSSDPSSNFNTSPKYLERSATPPLAAGNVSLMPRFLNKLAPVQAVNSAFASKKNVTTNFDSITSYKDKSVKVLSSENLTKLIKPRVSNFSTPPGGKTPLIGHAPKIDQKNEFKPTNAFEGEENEKHADYDNEENKINKEERQEEENDDEEVEVEEEEEEEVEEEEEEEEEDEEDEEDDDDESYSDNSSNSDNEDSGLTLNVPTYSQRMSIFNFNPRTSGRARSISLMGPAQQAPFLTKAQLDNESENSKQTNGDVSHIQLADELQESKASTQTNDLYDDRLTEEYLEDEMCSAKQNFQSSHYQNIYVHDGEAADDTNDIDEILFNVAQDGSSLSRKSSNGSFSTLNGSVRVSRARNLKNSNSKLNRFRTRSRSRSKHRSLSLSHPKTNNSSANSLIPPEFYSKIVAASPIPAGSSSALTSQNNSELSLKQNRSPHGDAETARTSDETVNSNTKINPVDINLLSPGNFGKYLTTGNRDLLVVREDTIKSHNSNINFNSVPQRKLSFDYEDVEANDHFALMFGSSNTKIDADHNHPDSGGQKVEANSTLVGQTPEQADNMPLDKNISLPRTFTGLINLKNLNLYSQTAENERKSASAAKNNSDVLDEEDLLMCGTDSGKNDDKNGDISESLKTTVSNSNDNEKPKIAYAKPALTLDLYGDGETDFNAWAFGANR
ncbi:hypothetical protein ACO0QE_002657 [Hanseniaspora vineae]